MACYDPVRAVLLPGPDGKRRLSFDRSSGGKGVSLPCGSCLGCKLERARQWAVRIMHEAKMHDRNSFVTLTYDDEHLPSGSCRCGRPDGPPRGHVAGSVCVDDLQKFFKRLRERIRPSRIRFFACGEYGEKLGRPHYHACLFGWFPEDAVCVKRAGELSLFSSSMLSAAWGLGFTSVGSLSFDSASYVANYASKQIRTNKADEAKRLAGRAREFLVMSRRPGIGRCWYDRFSGDVFPSDEVIVRGRACRPPRYYDKLQDGVDPEGMARIRLRREEAAEQLEEMVLASGSLRAVVAPCGKRFEQVRETVARAKLALKRRALEG